MPVLGELELGWRLLGGHEFIAVTGTNGKTTTVQLLGHIHREAGLAVEVAGNVGVGADGLRSAEPRAGRRRRLRGQLVSARGRASSSRPRAPCCSTSQPDHLDRHGTFEDYLGAKLRVFARQGNDDVAVAPADLDVEDLGGCARRVPFGPGGELDDRAGLAVVGRAAADRARGDPPARRAQPRQRGGGGGDRAGPRDRARRRARRRCGRSRGVEHRLEEVATVGGVLYVNDSKATNVASTLVALASFDAQVHLILGGLGKGQDFSALRGRAHRVYLIGEAAAQLEREVGGERCGTLETGGRARARGGAARRRRAAVAGVRELRPVRRLRGSAAARSRRSSGSGGSAAAANVSSSLTRPGARGSRAASAAAAGCRERDPRRRGCAGRAPRRRAPARRASCSRAAQARFGRRDRAGRAALRRRSRLTSASARPIAALEDGVREAARHGGRVLGARRRGEPRGGAEAGARPRARAACGRRGPRRASARRSRARRCHGWPPPHRARCLARLWRRGGRATRAPRGRSAAAPRPRGRRRRAAQPARPKLVAASSAAARAHA